MPYRQIFSLVETFISTGLRQPVLLGEVLQSQLYALRDIGQAVLIITASAGLYIQLPTADGSV